MSYRSDLDNRPAIPPTVKWLLIANGLTFLMQHIRPVIEGWLALWPNPHAGVVMTQEGLVAVNGFYPWQLITYGFLHSSGNLSHILFNMFGLWMFGQQIEEFMGSRRFLAYYLVCVVGAGLTHLAYAHYVGSPWPVLGASGGVFGVLLAFGMLFPRAKIMMLLFPVAIEARYLVLIYGIIELLNGVTGTNTGVAHFAHLGGMLFGLALILLWRRKGGALDPREHWQ